MGFSLLKLLCKMVRPTSLPYFFVCLPTSIVCIYYILSSIQFGQFYFYGYSHLNPLDGWVLLHLFLVGTQLMHGSCASEFRWWWSGGKERFNSDKIFPYTRQVNFWLKPHQPSSPSLSENLMIHRASKVLFKISTSLTELCQDVTITHPRLAGTAPWTKTKKVCSFWERPPGALLEGF